MYLRDFRGPAYTMFRFLSLRIFYTHYYSGDPLAPGFQKKNGEKPVTIVAITVIRKRASRLQEPLPFSSPTVHQVYLIQEFIFDRTLYLGHRAAEKVPAR